MSRDRFPIDRKIHIGDYLEGDAHVCIGPCFTSCPDPIQAGTFMTPFLLKASPEEVDR